VRCERKERELTSIVLASHLIFLRHQLGATRDGGRSPSRPGGPRPRSSWPAPSRSSGST